MNKTEIIDGTFFPASNEILLVEKFIDKMLQPVITWNDLMPVVEKIEEAGCIVEIWLSLGRGCRIVKVESKIQSWQTVMEDNSTIKSVWLAVIEFIKYLNSQPLK